MAALQSCFICSPNLDSDTTADNPQFNGSVNYKTVSVLCQVLEIPKSEIVSMRSSLEHAGFCGQCMGVFQQIDTTNKFLLEKTMVLQTKFKINCEQRRHEQEWSGKPFGPLDQLKDKIVRDLMSADRMVDLTKPLSLEQGDTPSISVQKDVKEVVNGQGQSQSLTVCEEASSLDEGQGILQPGTTLPDQGQSSEKGRTEPMMSNISVPRSSLGLGLVALLGTEVSNTNWTRGNTHWRSGHRSDSESVKFQGESIPFSSLPETIRKRISDSSSIPKTPIMITLDDADDSVNEGAGTSTGDQSPQSSTSQLSNTNASQGSAVCSATVSLEAPQPVLTLNSRSQAAELISSLPHSSGTASTTSSSSSLLSSSIFPPNPGSGNKRQSFNLTESNKRFRRSLSTDETVRVLEYMAESVKKGDLEKPNTDVYYTGLITALNIPLCCPTIIQSRIYSVRLNYVQFRREREGLLSIPQASTGVKILTSAQIESKKLFQYSWAVWGDDLDISNAQAQMNDVLNNTI